ncbi:MAG: hypothetical protein ABSB77_26455, partial [Xanthobacteraceae bacterium]
MRWLISFMKCAPGSQFFRGKIIDRDGRRDGVGGGFEFCRLVGDDIDAAEDHLVEGIRLKRLAQQQRPAALHGEVDRRERA